MYFEIWIFLHSPVATTKIPHKPHDARRREIKLITSQYSSQINTSKGNYLLNTRTHEVRKMFRNGYKIWSAKWDLEI